MKTNPSRLALLALLVLGHAGCEHLGPKTILADRLPYNNAVATSWQEQTLLNIVKLRYLDTPFFIDVAQIVGAYTVGDQVTPAVGVTPALFPHSHFTDHLVANLALQESFADRPTISYTPQTGAHFISNLTTPIPPERILFLIQAGYPADVVLPLAVDSINGVRNRSVSGAQLREADPAFNHLVRTIRRAQISGDVGIRVEQDKDKKEATVFTFRPRPIDPDLARELAEVRKSLGLNPDQNEFRVVFGGVSRSPNEIAILTRSVLRILSELSTFVEVPPEHLASGIAPDIGDTDGDPEPPFRVFSCVKKPADYLTAVCYEGHWFWIDKRDTRTKRTLGYLLVMLALAETGTREGLPVVTISAN
jgi:hypothetical protein